MDTTKTTTHVSLCSGYGGIDLGLRRVCPSLRTVAYAEIEAFAIELLLARMEGGQLDAAPIWSDLKSFPWRAFRDRVDLLSGGYPCQPFSAAGKRLGTEDPRHLWPFISAGIALMRPKLCFFENVEGHISMGLPDVIEDLARLGYRATWGIFSASEVGAPHQRKRVFILAHRSGEGLQGDIARLLVPRGRQKPSRPTAGGSRSSGERGMADSNGTGSGEDWKSSELAYSASDRLNGGLLDGETDKQTQGHAASRSSAWPSRPGEPQHWWEPPRVVGNFEQAEPSLGRDADGAPGRMDYAELCESCDNRTDELRLLGNGVVPATAALAFTKLIRQICDQIELHLRRSGEGIVVDENRLKFVYLRKSED